MIKQENQTEQNILNDDSSLNGDVFEKAWRITEFSKLVGRHHNTVYNWFNTLEEKELHETLRTNNTNEKLYNSLDLDIALFIKQKRDEKWSLDAIIELLPHQFKLRPVSLENQSKEILSQIDFQDASAAIGKLVEQKIREHMQDIEIQFQEKFENVLKALPQPEDPIALKERQRQERLDNIIIEHRARKELRKQAEKIWNEKPEEERLKKVGWFKKEENLAKKQLFIENYLEESMIEFMKSIMTDK
ncbi:MerR family transcriptional regulator [Bacillus cereus]|uniref:MerR family transcriptional regulator n=1 Tax=Bacillus cereus TaxID=1396 RepID=UPI000BED089F|nr:MerR family transcriptional regulator [Bacillus cereus]PEA00894.1 MerR family transcriptional regulator [Bacillus cereus]